jgi:hypothetical protein
MSALPNNLSSTAFYAQTLFLEQIYSNQTYTETSRSFSDEVIQNNIFLTIQDSMSSISNRVADEDELSPYECARSSGTLNFWDDPEEDIYTLEDGQPL